jgi:hypothetical protein
VSFVYFIQCGGPGGPIKIGRAFEPKRRIDNLQLGCPYKLRLIAKIWCGNEAERVEADLHARLKEHRMRGEWFTVAILPEAERIQRLAATTATPTRSDPAVPVVDIVADPRRPRQKRGRLQPGEFLWRGKVRRSNPRPSR